MTTSSRIANTLFGASSTLRLTGSTVKDFSLAHLTDSIANCLALALMTGRNSLVVGWMHCSSFDLGLEAMESGRSAWKMLETGTPTAELMPVSSAKVLTPEW